MSRLTLFLLLAALLGSRSAVAQPLRQGVVYAYGVRLEPPYVFSGAHEDTLRINGYPYAPRRALPTVEVEREEPVLSREHAEAINEVSELLARLDSIAASVTGAQEKTDVYTAGLTQHPKVTGVREEEGAVVFFFKGVPHEVVAYTTAPDLGDLGLSRREIRAINRERAESMAASTLRANGLLVFGPEYTIHSPPQNAAKHLEEIDRVEEVLASGRRLSPAEWPSAPLGSAAFLRDLIEHAKTSGLR
jgi:hypothetical protein